MAEEIDHIPVSNKIDRNDEDKTKDHSSEKPYASNKRVDTVPHYLRSSTGSCHDACKYGKPHVFKEKPWRLMGRRMSAPLPNGEATLEIRIFVDKKVKKAVEVDKLVLPSSKEPPPAIDKVRRSYPSSRKSPLHDSSILVKQEARYFTKSLRTEVPTVTRKVIQSPGKSSLPVTLKLSKQEVASDAKKYVSSKQTLPNAKERAASAGSLKPNSIAVKPSFSLDAFRVANVRKTSATKFGDNSSNRVAVKNVLAPAATTLSVKRTVNSKSEVKKLLDPSAAISSRPSLGVRAARTNNTRMTDSNGKKDQNQRSQASAKNQVLTNKAVPKEPINEIVEEKTLHMLETRLSAVPTRLSQFIQSPSPLSPESFNSSNQANSLSFTSHEVDDQCELDTDYTDSEGDDSVSNYNGSGAMRAMDRLKKGDRQTCNSGDRDPASLQLKFRRGKVIDLQSETNSPRMLRFRQGGMLGSDQGGNVGSRRRSCRRRAAATDKMEGETGLVKVALKHQEVVTKKDEQVLLNNVIEETASKLVAKRKSKVKALVGAFESVISLQDQERRPSATKR